MSHVKKKERYLYKYLILRILYMQFCITIYICNYVFLTYSCKQILYTYTYFLYFIRFIFYTLIVYQDLSFKTSVSMQKKRLFLSIYSIHEPESIKHYNLIKKTKKNWFYPLYLHYKILA